MSKQLIVIIAAVLLSVVGTSLVIGRPASGESCNGITGTTYMVTVHNGKVSEPEIKGKLCDKLMFMNEDKLTREIAFGPHEDHMPYDGVAEKVLNQGQYFTVTLNQTGSYHWHDHLHDEVEGYFSVSR